MNPSQTERFIKLCLDVQQKHIEVCGCPADMESYKLINLQFLVSQPAPCGWGSFHAPATELISPLDHQKLNLLYSAKPFCFSPSILPAIASHPLSVFKMISKLAESKKLDKLPLLENKLYCEEGTRILVRKQVGNPLDYFFKTFAEYQEGFSANGESWLGLDNLHRLTSQRDYKLKITMTDFDGQKYHAVYDQFKVGPGDDYVLTVRGFDDALSTLGDSMTTAADPWSDGHPKSSDGMKFGTKDKYHNPCPGWHTGGWWYNYCHYTHPTGQHSSVRTSKSGSKYINYYHGGGRGDSFDSWAEAEYLLVPI